MGEVTTAAGAAVAPPEVWQYGVLGVMAFVFAVAIIYLFKLYVRRIGENDAKRDHAEAAHLAERTAAATREEAIRTACAETCAELAEKFANDLRQVYEDNRIHEDAARREFAILMEQVSEQAGKSSSEVVRVLDKFYDRFVGPRARRY